MQYGRSQSPEWNRFQIVFVAFGVFFALIGLRLGWLQIVQGAEFVKVAEEQNTRGIVLPARRGTIFAQDYRTGELHPLAQNSTTYTIFADPLLLTGEPQLAAQLAELLWRPEMAAEFMPAEPATGANPSQPAAPADPAAQVQAQAGAETPGQTATGANPTGQPGQVAQQVIDPKTLFAQKILGQLSTKDVTQRILPVESEEALRLIASAQLPGISVATGQLVINPNLIANPADTATQLAAVLEKQYNEIYPLLRPQKVRYVRLASRVDISIREAIVALNVRGIGSIPEYRRVYPEKELAANVVGFINNEGQGTYGIEGSFQRALAGKDGLRRTQVDPFNRQITVGDVTIEDAVDGADVVLTIDRAIQSFTERELAKVVNDQRADGGQAIVMDPKTGAILALAQVPTFDPNNYGQVYEREEIRLDETGKSSQIVTEYEKEYVIRQGFRYPVFYEPGENGALKAVIYTNRVGSGALAMKPLTDPYEPGSIFKPIAMAAALDAGLVTPNTRSSYSGPIELDEYIGTRQIVIKNANNKYSGRETMTEVIGNSSNIGMAFVVQKLGRAMFYDYLKRFGFAERTDIELDGENTGKVANYTTWSEAELITKSFGQGLTVNLIQMAAAYSALANGGLLMQPYIVAEEIRGDGSRVATSPKTIRRVISREASSQITSILITSVNQFYARTSRVEGYLVAGKTGTSQTYSRSGQPFTQLGTTVTSFAGYAPATDPKFVMVIKIERPRVVQWGEQTAGIVFKNVADELVRNYYAVAPKN